VKLFFPGKMAVFLENEKLNQIYHELHIITLETAFVVRTFFFVVFGLSIAITSLFSFNVALISLLIVVSIYAIRFLILKVFVGKDILPQLFVAPRGLITVLLFYAIPVEAQVENFESGILLFVIIATSLVMTWAMIKDKKKMSTLLDEIDEEYKERNEAEDILREKKESDLIEKNESNSEPTEEPEGT
jgi:NhaP-type Na+/H+ or K+/H+ antiporter